MRGWTSGRSTPPGKNCRSRLTALALIWFLWDVKEPTPLFEKSRGRRPRWCGQPSHIIHILGWVGKSKFINGLIPAASGAFVCWHPRLLLEGTSVVLLSMTRFFLPSFQMGLLIKAFLEELSPNGQVIPLISIPLLTKRIPARITAIELTDTRSHPAPHLPLVLREKRWGRGKRRHHGLLPSPMTVMWSTG